MACQGGPAPRASSSSHAGPIGHRPTTTACLRAASTWVASQPVEQPAATRWSRAATDAEVRLFDTRREARSIGTWRVSPIGLGAMPLSLAGRPDRAQAVRTIHAALDAGVTLIDTADAYCTDRSDTGHNE